MAQVHPLPVKRPQPADEKLDRESPPAGELVALPFIELDTVVKTMKMLRRFPDQRVLDNFNRTVPSTNTR